MQHKFQVGDWVMVKPNANTIKCKDGLDFDPDKKMLQYLGGTFQVSYAGGDEYPRYHLEGCKDDEDGYSWWWDETWLDYSDEEEIEINDESIDELFGDLIV